MGWFPETKIEALHPLGTYSDSLERPHDRIRPWKSSVELVPPACLRRSTPTFPIQYRSEFVSVFGLAIGRASMVRDPIAIYARSFLRFHRPPNVTLICNGCNDQHLID